MLKLVHTPTWWQRWDGRERLSLGRFDFKCPDAWPKWKRRFQQYLTATGLDKEEDARKISMLLYCLGEESEDVLTSINITEADRKKYDSVVENSIYSSMSRETLATNVRGSIRETNSRERVQSST